MSPQKQGPRDEPLDQHNVPSGGGPQQALREFLPSLQRQHSGLEWLYAYRRQLRKGSRRLEGSEVERYSPWSRWGILRGQMLGRGLV